MRRVFQADQLQHRTNRMTILVMGGDDGAHVKVLDALTLDLREACYTEDEVCRPG